MGAPAEYVPTSVRHRKIEDAAFSKSIDMIQQAYQSESTTQSGRDDILGSLEKISGDLNLPKNSGVEDYVPLIAKDIRNDVGITQEALGKMIGIDPIHIRGWENGERIPRPKNKGDDVQNDDGALPYMEWLKDNGYDPFNL